MIIGIVFPVKETGKRTGFYIVQGPDPVAGSAGPVEFQVGWRPFKKLNLAEDLLHCEIVIFYLADIGRGENIVFHANLLFYETERIETFLVRDVNRNVHKERKGLPWKSFL